MGAPSHSPAPKSGCSPRVSPMLAISAAESGSTGALEMSVFHALSAGNGSAPFRLAPAPSDAACRLP